MVSVPFTVHVNPPFGFSFVSRSPVIYLGSSVPTALGEFSGPAPAPLHVSLRIPGSGMGEHCPGLPLFGFSVFTLTVCFWAEDSWTSSWTSNLEMWKSHIISSIFHEVL